MAPIFRQRQALYAPQAGRRHWLEPVDANQADPDTEARGEKNKPRAGQGDRDDGRDEQPDTRLSNWHMLRGGAGHMQPRAQVGATPPQLENPDCTVQAEDQKLWCNKYVPGSVKRSKIHAKTAVQISEESFDVLLQEVYEQKSGHAQQMVDDMQDNIDLSYMAQHLPKPEDLLESADEAPIIRLINALLTTLTA